MIGAGKSSVQDQISLKLLVWIHCLSSMNSYTFLHHRGNCITFLIVMCDFLACLRVLQVGIKSFISAFPGPESHSVSKENMNKWLSSLSTMGLWLSCLSEFHDWREKWYLCILATRFLTSKKSSSLKMEYIFPSTHVKNFLWGLSEMGFCYFSIITDVFFLCLWMVKWAFRTFKEEKITFYFLDSISSGFIIIS